MSASRLVLATALATMTLTAGAAIALTADDLPAPPAAVTSPGTDVPPAETAPSAPADPAGEAPEAAVPGTEAPGTSEGAEGAVYDCREIDGIEVCDTFGESDEGPGTYDDSDEGPGTTG